MTLETFGLYFGLVSGLATLHGWWITTIRTGKARDEAVAHLASNGQTIEPLYENIETSTAIPPPMSRSDGERVLLGKDSMRKVVKPLHEQMEEPALVTSAISMPRKLGRALSKNPLELFRAKPVTEYQEHPGPGYTSVSFMHKGRLHVGWKPRDEVSRLLGCDSGPDATPSAAIEVSAKAARDRVILDLPAHRSSLFNVNRQCRFRLTDQSLKFVDERQERESYEIPRVAIDWIRLYGNRELLEIATNDGKKRKLEATLRNLRQVKEHLVGV